MNELPKSGNVNCQWLLNELDALPADEPRGATPEEWLSALPQEVRTHVARCTECEAALQDFAVTRRALERMQETLPEPGPWFAGRVMRAIDAHEAELEETQNGFWTSVRRLAPRIVAFATLLLMLGGTWMFTERRAAHSRGQEVLPVEGIFETLPSTPVNDDVIATYHDYEVQHP
jgi:hypothetical protein